MLSVTAIAIGNGTDKWSSKTGQSCLHFTLCLCPWEKHKSICSPPTPAMDK